MATKQRFFDLIVYSSVIGAWLVSGWDSEEQLTFEMTVNYWQLVRFAADEYYEGNKKTAERYLDSLDANDFEQEVKNYFIHKMS